MKTAIIQEIFHNPLDQLRIICATFKIPSLSELENKLRTDNTIIDDAIAISSLYYEWNDLHNMFHILKGLKPHFAEFPDDGQLLKNLFIYVNDIYQNALVANSIAPIPKGKGGISGNRLFFNSMVKDIHKKASALYVQIHKSYLTEICQLLSRVRINYDQDITANNVDEPPMCIIKKRNTFSLIKFMELFCNIEEGQNLQNKANYIHKASRESKIELPPKVIETKKGQSNYYYFDELVNSWPGLCKELPTIPELDPEKMTNSKIK